MCSKQSIAARAGIASLLMCLAIGAGAAFVPTERCVSVSNRKKPDERVLSKAMLSGFSISYTHSVNKGRVHDYYRCDGSTLVLDREEFVSYGAGIPEASETEGASFLVTDQGYAVTGLHRRLKTLVMAVGVIAEHSITTYTPDAAEDEHEIFLKDLFAPQTSLVFEIKRIPLLPYLLARHV